MNIPSLVLRSLASTSARTRVRPSLPKGGRPGGPSKAALVLTDSAVKRVAQLIDEHPGALGVRIGVATRGCNGLTYTMDMAFEKQKFDEEVLQDGARAQLTLLGSEMDYVEEKLSSEFVFNNPNIKGTCGCGESFTL